MMYVNPRCYTTSHKKMKYRHWDGNMGGPEGIMLSELSQTEDGKNGMISLISGI